MMKLRECGETWVSQENGHFSLNNGSNSFGQIQRLLQTNCRYFFFLLICYFCILMYNIPTRIFTDLYFSVMRFLRPLLKHLMSVRPSVRFLQSRENFGGISCENSRFYAKKAYYRISLLPLTSNSKN
jgi:hypothetical protein